MGLDAVLSDLEAEGYQARCFVIPAVAADAPHRRDRCWIVGYSDSSSLAGVYSGEPKQKKRGSGFEARRKDVADATRTHCGRGRISERIHSPNTEPNSSRNTGRLQTPQFWEPEPAVGRVANGVPGRVHRLRQLGNSIVPQVAARILWAIKETHNG